MRDLDSAALVMAVKIAGAEAAARAPAAADLRTLRREVCSVLPWLMGSPEMVAANCTRIESREQSSLNREGETPAEPIVRPQRRLGRSLALPTLYNAAPGSGADEPSGR